MSNVSYVVYYKDSGKVFANGSASLVTSVNHFETEETSVLFIENDVDWDECYVDLETLTLVKIDKRPSYSYVLNMDIKQWEKDPELSAREIRLERDRLLANTDWTQNSDVTEATRNLYTEYRQQLRDITTQDSFPESVTWPVAPN